MKNAFIKEKFYTLTNKASGKSLESGGLKGNGWGSTADIMESAPSDTDAQRFQLYQCSDGVYYIVCKDNGRSVTAGNGTDVEITQTRMLDSQKWRIDEVGDRCYKIQSLFNNNYLTGNDGISQTVCSNSENQIWEIELVTSKDWTLVWSDEFDGAEVDASAWTFETGYARNDELQNYTDSPANAFVKDSILTIKTIKEPSYAGNIDKWMDYSSASLLTKDKKAFTFGRFEIKAKLPKGQAIWPAFWMMDNDTPWPYNGEIDIMELWGGPDTDNRLCVTVWCVENGENKGWGQNQIRLLNGEKFADDFHRIGLEWDETQLRFYLDGLLFNTLQFTTPELRETFSKPFHLWINTAVSPDVYDRGDASENTYPQTYEIDYVRVYQQI